LSLSSEKLVSIFAFKWVNLYRYIMVYAASKRMLFSVFVDKLAALVAKEKEGADVAELTERLYMSEISGNDYAMRCNTTAKTCAADTHRPDYLDKMIEDGVALPDWWGGITHNRLEVRLVTWTMLAVINRCFDCKRTWRRV
jgi:hypothetical protein